ncbi:RNA dependent RNA polymerase-domain-containing protein [Aspergillus bertholletiae]|uniref:RNA-dependent RNA polymerase n=1 Tax=Aspergillus bertholletiae TaxID=1226010 RepID=A0A5N7AZG0_9EURO|nr:RNA dependent RNA polymerase-domain-containing protein [Aspergillus bertholletiae]
MALPHTPRRGKDLYQLIDKLNEQYGLHIPNPQIYSPTCEPSRKSLGWSLNKGIKRLYYDRNVDLNQTLNNFDEWVASRQVWPNAGFHSRNAFKRDPFINNYDANVSEIEREERLGYLMKLVDDELYILTKGSHTPFFDGRDGIIGKATVHLSPSNGLKRRMSEDGDEFYTAPNSPVKPGSAADGPLDLIKDEGGSSLDSLPTQVFKSPKINDTGAPSAFVQRLTAPDHARRYDAVLPAQDDPTVSFATTEPASVFESRQGQLNTSFTSITTEAMSDLDGEDSVANHMLSEESRALQRLQNLGESHVDGPPESAEQRLIDNLLQYGPFAQEYSFAGTIPLRYRYELERIGRAWNISSDRMLAGKKISFKTRDEFWEWIKGHNQRNRKPLPEKPTNKAWDFAIGSFKTDKHSEAVVLTGDLEWCKESEPGIFKLNLNPLKAERTCRFHRRFGSDRFLSLKIPAPSRPPRHFSLLSDPSLSQEAIALWLTQNVHRCLGRIWKPFFVEEVKQKRKANAEPKFRVDFFAIDGVDFDKSSHAPPIPPAKQTSKNHTLMSLDSLFDWHMPRVDNIGQKNCKLFQRISLGLSKTLAAVSLKPSQILHLEDPPNPMNDGCALMSRALANRICDSLGITGTTPSAFQGRIAGAKGLWMVDKHDSDISTDSQIWIQISDSQLKIKPHPKYLKEPVDEEKLTFEVVKWSKSLHTVDLNTQLLAILECGGHIREYVADLTRAGIRAVYEDFEQVVQSNSPVLCRSLIQKIRPPAESSNIAMFHKARRLEDWMADDAEVVIRLTEAGFAPRTFHPLWKRLRKCLIDLLNQYVEQLHIEVPLSTYAFCIADPYGVLKEDEVHFGFSSNWRDPQGQFEDNILDGMDVLVARLPAHLPSDIQRRRAVWKPELRHFKDVIVFPTVGTTPLAHMLSGGDYDGDTPWVCWDQNIVQKFHNSDLPAKEYPPEYFGLKTYNVPMNKIQSWDEFLESTFTFNLTMSNLGMCTVEHENISYDESIDSPGAIELTYLLGQLVDGRKGGVCLPEQAWRTYRKKISPRARDVPAYRNPRRRPKLTNIIDYLRFEVAQKEKDNVLTQLEGLLARAGTTYEHDRDLTRPWDEAREAAEKDRREGGQLHVILKIATQEIDDLYDRWKRSVTGENSFSAISLDIADQARAIPPPEGDHTAILVWRCSKDAWLQLLASYLYKRHPESSFVFHAFGEALCQLKASNVPSRLVINEILACYRVNQRVLARLAAKDMVEDEDSDCGDEYEGADAIAMLQGTQLSTGYYDWDDSL